MTEQKSIYELISGHIVNGRLDEAFVLPDDSEGPVRFAAGAMDGVCVYHMLPYKMTAEDHTILEKSVAAVAKGDFEQTDTLWAQLGKTARAIQVVDQFQQYIGEHADEIDVATAYPCIFDIVCRSVHIESIKFGLEIMELLDTGHDFIKNVIRTIGLSDEFTIFAAWIMRGWDNGNNELFELAKKVKGWGRIHIVKMLEPDTEEIKDWLLTEGTKNDVVYAYSALPCWRKSDAEQRLYGNHLTYSEFSGLLTLADALLDEGPVWGISQIENPDEILSRLVSWAKQFTPSIDDYEMIRQISIFTKDQDQYSLTMQACDIVLLSDHCRLTVEKAVREGMGIKLAVLLGIDYKEHLMLCLEKDFLNHRFDCHNLLNDSRYLNRILDVFRKNLPFEEMIGAPQDSIGVGKDFEGSMTYQMLLQDLQDMPFVGTDMVQKGLKCRTLTCRNAALECVRKWVMIRQMPLQELSPELFEAVSVLFPVEPNEKARISEEELLKGKTDFSV